ncbi:MAG TPA: hypothetical protein VIB38_08570 [Aestuariivirgaceae bacterium]|jgi:hypothetical protein
MRRKFWCGAAAVLLVLWLGRTGLAADYLIFAGTTETTPATLDMAGDSLTVEEGGALSVAAGDAAVMATADDFVITNGGTIEYFDFIDGSIVVLSSQGGVIHNEATGTITSTTNGITANHERFDDPQSWRAHGR